ncbi:unnamed protein product [Orchesella dallaii]|uniref:Tudor domain-containing protein n=1 Tax=Orchesella dallaii TaxID=48710 RepID=A0ABP1PNX0_9HEXA
MEKPSTSYNIEPRKVIYCEDDYFEVNSEEYYHMKCDISLQPASQPPLPFNYSRFTEYLQLKSHIEFVNRTVEASTWLISPRLDYYTDEKLKDELAKIYGEMDETSTKFELIFKNYKIQRLEQLNEWMKVEAQLIKANEMEDGVTYAPYGSESMDEELRNHFTEDELANFRTISQKGCSSLEPFILPRKKAEIRGNKNREDTHAGPLNSKQIIIEKEVTTVLNQSPLGITRDKLILKCNERFRKIDKLPYSSSGGYALKLTSNEIKGVLSKNVLFTRDFQGGYLVFPSSLESVLLQDPKTILWNLKHRLLVVLNLSYGIIEVDECIDLCFNLFQIKRFQYRDWGFVNGVTFVKWLLDQWNTRDVEVIELSLSKNGGNTKYYLAVMTEERRKLVKQYSMKENSCTEVRPTKKSVIEKTGNKVKIASCNQLESNKLRPSAPTSLPSISSHPQNFNLSSPWSKNMPQSASKPPLLNYNPNATSISPQFVQLGDKVYEIQDEINPGLHEDCVVSILHSPTNFYLVRKGKWREVNRLLNSLCYYWNSKPNEMLPHPKFLQKNYICMAKTENAEEGEEDVYRVVILGKSNETYEVFCIDYGDVLTVRHDQLRFLPREYLTTLEAQAIQCSIYNVASQTKDNGNDIWNESACKFTRQLFNQTGCDTPIVKVHFKQRVYGNGIWLVKVSLPPNCMDFGEEIMKFVDNKK